MNLSAIRSTAMLAGGAVAGGAIIGGGIGAVQALRQEPSGDGLTTMEKRSVLANAIVGAGVGAVAGVALLGARNLVKIPALTGLKTPGMIALGMGTGAAGLGAWTLGRSAFD